MGEYQQAIESFENASVLLENKNVLVLHEIDIFYEESIFKNTSRLNKFTAIRESLSGLLYPLMFYGVQKNYFDAGQDNLDSQKIESFRTEWNKSKELWFDLFKILKVQDDITDENTYNQIVTFFQNLMGMPLIFFEDMVSGESCTREKYQEQLWEKFGNLMLLKNPQDISESEQEEILKIQKLLSLIIFDNYKEVKCYEEAIIHLDKMKTIYEDAQDIEGLIDSLNSIGEMNLELGKFQESIKILNQALKLWQTGNRENLYRQVDTLLMLGKNHIALERYDKAQDYLTVGLKLSEDLGYVSKKVELLFEIAKIQKIKGEFKEAKKVVELTLKILESQRLKISKQENFSYLNPFSDDLEYSTTDRLNRRNTVDTNFQSPLEFLDYFERLSPNIVANTNIDDYKSYEKLASYLDERRNYYEFYIELLMELHRQNLSEDYYIQALEANELNRAYSLLSFLNDNVQSKESHLEIETLPKFNKTLNIKGIQQQTLDDNTVLLEYALGKERSYLWFITKDKIQIFELPSKQEIETTARKFYDYLTQPHLRTKDNQRETVGLQLSQLLFSPIADQLENQRLLVVADGALQNIPFAAIPIPQSQAILSVAKPKDIAKPLLVNHEIIHLPSALTLAEIRQRENNRPAPNKTLAVFADPVFGRGDSNQIYAPLPRTREQAERISATLPANSDTPLLLYGDDADRDRAIRALEEHQIVHFATHGILDTQNPTRSGVVLSAYNKQGNIQRGLISTSDLFNLEREIAADLVFLSGCRTGLGKEYRGEGIVGLTGGFLSAGAERVVVSLWSVEQEATIELTERFYQQMFDNKLSPAAALRAAQISMWEDPKWKTPYNWAAFTIQGEWKEMQ